jgi:hypothetical protein
MRFHEERAIFSSHRYINDDSLRVGSCSETALISVMGSPPKASRAVRQRRKAGSSA